MKTYTILEHIVVVFLMNIFWKMISVIKDRGKNLCVMKEILTTNSDLVNIC